MGYGHNCRWALDERSSAQMIIMLLQKELLTSTTPKSVCGSDFDSTDESGGPVDRLDFSNF